MHESDHPTRLLLNYPHATTLGAGSQGFALLEPLADTLITILAAIIVRMRTSPDRRTPMTVVQ